MQALVLCLVALTAPHLAFAKSDVAIEDSVNVAAPPAGVSKGSNQKIAAVTATLRDILQSVVNEEKQETAIYDKYMSWCKTEQDDIASDTSGTKTALGNAKVLNEEQLSQIDSLTLFIKKSEKEIEETKDAIAQAIDLRTDENDKYKEDMQINTQSLRQIAQAIKHVGKVNKQGGFLQNGVVKKLQINQPGESSYVLGIMKGLQEKLEKTRAELKKTEEEKVKMHDSFMKTKGTSLKMLQDTTTEKTILLTETTAKQSGTKRKIGKLTDDLAKLVENGSKVNESCQTAKHDWKVRQADRIKEKAALTEAVQYLKDLAFQQISLVQKEPVNSNEDLAVFAPSFLQTDDTDKEFDEATNAAFASEGDAVAAHAQKGAFKGVKNVVAKLIATHQDDQKEEKDKKAYCNTEIASKEDDKADTSNALAAVKADIEKKTSEVEMLADEIKKLYAAIDKVRKSLEAAGKVRKEENAVFVAGSKDRALAIKVLGQAKAVLQQFYDKSLLQSDGPPQYGGRKKAASFGAVSMVQDIADDIAKEQKDAAMQENEAAEAYARLQRDSREAEDDKQQDVTDRVKAKAKLGVQINTLKETRQAKSDDLNAITKQLVALHKECDELLEYYNKRKKARSFEVSQLRDVMDILSGSNLAARTFLQEKEAAPQEKEAAPQPVWRADLLPGVLGDAGAFLDA